MKNKSIIVTGASGQTGSYMVDYLLSNTDFNVVGVARRSSKPDYSNLAGPRLDPRFSLEMADLSDGASLDNLVQKIQPDYFINFAAQSFVGASWQIPEQTFDSCAMGVLRCLEAIRKHCITCRFYNAGSSEEMGDIIYSPQDMRHPARARSPYGAAKIAARQIVKVYRESYNMYAIQGLLYNHESERRGEEFVTRKITKGVAKIRKQILAHESITPIELGNVDAKRDWSHALDFVDGVWRMLNQEEHRRDLIMRQEEAINQQEAYHAPKVTDLKEYLLASGETHTIREFVQKAFRFAEIYGGWMGEGEEAKFTISQHGGFTRDAKPAVIINPKFYRPAEVELLLGDSSEARKELGWKPKISFDNLVYRMVQHDLNEYL